MKTWIKILALGLVLCMTVAMIAACGAPAAQGNESGTEAGQETARETEKDTEGQPGKETETDKPGDKETVKETDKATETEPETDPPVTQSAFGQPLAKYTRPFASNDGPISRASHRTTRDCSSPSDRPIWSISPLPSSMTFRAIRISNSICTWRIPKPAQSGRHLPDRADLRWTERQRRTQH